MGKKSDYQTDYESRTADDINVDSDFPAGSEQDDMKAEDLTFDDIGDSGSSGASKEEKSHSEMRISNSQKRDNFRRVVSDFAVSMYTYAAGLKEKGHVTLAEDLFRNSLKVLICTNSASGALSHERFVALLEEGYYAASGIAEYMDFIETIDCRGEMHEPLKESLHRILRGLASSVKTSRSKRQVVRTGL